MVASKPFQLIDDVAHGNSFCGIGGLQGRHWHAVLGDHNFLALGDYHRAGMRHFSTLPLDLRVSQPNVLNFNLY